APVLFQGRSLLGAEGIVGLGLGRGDLFHMLEVPSDGGAVDLRRSVGLMQGLGKAVGYRLVEVTKNAAIGQLKRLDIAFRGFRDADRLAVFGNLFRRCVLARLLWSGRLLVQLLLEVLDLGPEVLRLLEAL